MMTLNEITIDYLYSSNELSTRAYNICINGQIKTMEDLRIHIQKNGNFKTIRGCGKKTHKELLLISKRKEVSFSTQPKENEPLTIFDYQFEIRVKSAFEKLLGVRARNALMLFLDDNLTKEKIEKEIIEKDFSKVKLQNIGKKTSLEIEQFISAVIALHQKIVNEEES